MKLNLFIVACIFCTGTLAFAGETTSTETSSPTTQKGSFGDKRGPGRAGFGGDGGEHRHGPRGIPPDAVEACAGKSSGGTATTTLPDGKKIEGTCKLVLVPSKQGQ